MANSGTITTTHITGAVRRHKMVIFLSVIMLGMLSGCVAPGDISVGKVYATDYAIKNVRTFKTNLVVPVSNRSNYKLSIKKYETYLYSGGDLLGKATGHKEIVISAQTDSIYVIPIEFDYEQSISQGFKTITLFLLRGEMEIQTSGKISGRLGVIPFHRRFRQAMILRRGSY